MIKIIRFGEKESGMLKEILERSIWKILKQNNYKMVLGNEGDIWFVKRHSEQLAYYIRCNESMETIYVTFYFTAIQVPDVSLTTRYIGLNIEIGFFGYDDNTLLESAGEKIIAIENNTVDVAEVILDELEEPYFKLNINEPFNENLLIYNVINEDEKLQVELKELKSKACEYIKEGVNEKLLLLCDEFIDKIPNSVFEEEKICFDLTRIKRGFCEQIFAQCVLDA